MYFWCVTLKHSKNGLEGTYEHQIKYTIFCAVYCNFRKMLMIHNMTLRAVCSNQMINIYTFMSNPRLLRQKPIKKFSML